MLGPSSIVISPSHAVPDTAQESHSTNKLLVFEVPPSLHLHSLTLRGTDSVVLCDESQTCTLRQAETSNLLLFLQQSDHHNPPVSNAYGSQHDSLPTSTATVIDSGSCYFEALESRPTPELLIDELQKSIYTGLPDHADTTMAHLLTVIPASRGEIMDFLLALNAVEIQGVWRIVDDSYHLSILELILLSITEEDEAWDAVHVPFF